MTYQGQAVTLLPGRLRGYRQWLLVDLTGAGDYVLQSITAKTRWPWTPYVEARCHRQSWGPVGSRMTECAPEDVPRRDCTCGIYAKHSPSALSRASYPVAGVIDGWGPHTEIGDEGFRSRYARIRALWLAPVREKTPLPIWAPMGPGWHEWTPQSELPRPPDEKDPTAAIRNALSGIYHVPVYEGFETMVNTYPPVDIASILQPSVSPGDVSATPLDPDPSAPVHPARG